MRSLLKTIVLACLVAGGIVCPCVEAAGMLVQHADSFDDSLHKGHHANHHAGTHEAASPLPDPTGIESEHCCDLPAVLAASPGDDPDDSSATLAPWLDKVLQPDAAASPLESPPGRPPDSPVTLRDRLVE